MSQLTGHWWVMNQESREVIRTRLAEAERDRLVRQARGSSPSARARLAGALRAIANRLDGEAGSSGEPRLCPSPAAAR